MNQPCIIRIIKNFVEFLLMATGSDNDNEDFLRISESILLNALDRLIFAELLWLKSGADCGINELFLIA